MVSWGEILVTVTAAGYLLGRRELPKIGHFVGTYCGRSVGAILRAKKEFFDATKDNEIVKLQREFQRGIDELNEIRAELSSVGSLARPHQPTASAPSTASTNTSTAAAAVMGMTPASHQQHIVSNAASSVASSTASPPVSSSLAMASADYAAMGAYVQPQQQKDHASLALAEIKLAQQGKYSTRIESLEGGADYVSASIVDSLLLVPQEPKKPKNE